MPDFEITVTANLDPEVPPVAVGATGGIAEPADFEHVRNWVRGMLIQLSGGLPPGWDMDVVTLTATRAQRDVNVDPRKPVLTLVAPDRLAQVEQDECGACSGVLRRDTPDGIWYHVPQCADPTPRGKPARSDVRSNQNEGR